MIKKLCRPCLDVDHHDDNEGVGETLSCDFDSPVQVFKRLLTTTTSH